MENEGNKAQLLLMLRPRYHLPSVLNFVLSKHEVATYLLSKDPAPPCVLGNETIHHSVALRSLVIHEQPSGLALQRPKQIDQGDQSEISDPRDPRLMIKQNVNLIPKDNFEILFYTPYFMTDEYSLISATDERIPLAFLEKPYPAVPGLRRVVLIKLDGMGSPGSLALVQHTWLTNGRSSVVVMLYSIEPDAYAEKYFVLFEKYPVWRYPRMDDVLETLMAVEVFVCPFCETRGEAKCECSKAMLERMKIKVPDKDARSSWQLFNWVVNFETSLRKYVSKIVNVATGIDHVSTTYHRGFRSFHGQESHTIGTQNYLGMLRPFCETLIVSKRSRSLYLLCDEGHAKNDETTSQKISNIQLARLENSNPSDQWTSQPRVTSFLDKESNYHPNQEVHKAHSARLEAISPNYFGLCPSLTRPSHELSHISPDAVATVLSSTESRGTKRKSSDAEESPGQQDSEKKGSGLPNSSSSSGEAASEQYLLEVEEMSWPAFGGQACRICGINVARKYDLKRHILSKHLSRRSVVCSECGMEFTRTAHLTSHFRARHQNIKHTCQVCNRDFSYIGALRRHQKHQHNDSVPEEE